MDASVVVWGPGDENCGKRCEKQLYLFSLPQFLSGLVFLTWAGVDWSPIGVGWDRLGFGWTPTESYPLGWLDINGA